MKNRKTIIHAYNAVAAAKRKGILIPQPCSACGKKAEAHHNDYTKPLEIVWLCRQHHRLIDTSNEGRPAKVKKEKVEFKSYKPKTPGGKLLFI